MGSLPVSAHRTPLISVCIPVFNGEKYIRGCIASVLAQSEPDFELLISDNCSTDRTLEICREFSDPRIRIIRNARNIGSIENFSQCVRSAIGELFILLPVDDLLEKDCLQLLSRGFREHPSVGIAFGACRQIDDQGNTIREKPLVEQTALLHREQAIKMIAEDFNPIQHPMVRSKLFLEIGAFNEGLGCFSDIYLWSKALFLGVDAYVVSQPVTAMRCYDRQGQTLFLQNTKDNLRLLSGHYGQALPPSFYRKNHYNLLFSQFVRFFNGNLAGTLSNPGDTENTMLRNLVRSHLGNAYLSVRGFNLPSLAMELALSVKLAAWFGPIRILRAYSAVLGEELFSTRA